MGLIRLMTELKTFTNFTNINHPWFPNLLQKHTVWIWHILNHHGAHVKRDTNRPNYGRGCLLGRKRENKWNQEICVTSYSYVEICVTGRFSSIRRCNLGHYVCAPFKQLNVVKKWRGRFSTQDWFILVIEQWVIFTMIEFL